jgi:2,3-bisphosphoglycerate-independent phosphoglycerate mutase
MLLCILDGFGLNPETRGNAVKQGEAKNFEQLYSMLPATTLVTCGERVGLPDGQMGNSEVGHLNIGAGRVVEQWLLRISRALAGEFLSNSAAYTSFLGSLKEKSAVHLVGLYSDGGVHSHCDHLKLLVKRLSKDFRGTINLHLITDGRDTGPRLGAGFIADLEKFLSGFPTVRIATVSGRFYAMDRDKRWERTELAYRAIVEAIGHTAKDAVSWIESSYAKDVTDEFIEPAIINRAPIGPEDSVIFWNFREDRMRQIVRAICIREFDGFSRAASLPSPLQVLGFTDYDHTFHLPFLFSQIDIKNHIGEVLAQRGLKQLRVAESEKYPHVTYFFNGGIEVEYPGETRTMVPSPRDVKTYDLRPQMSAYQVTEVVLEALASNQYDFIVVNFANCDMVGHTGVLEATIEAVRTVDDCLGRIMTALQSVRGRAIIIADHGNAEQMINYQDGSPHTAHTTFPVPMIVVGTNDVTGLESGGALCDVAPTILDLMDIPKPAEMTGRSLLIR